MGSLRPLPARSGLVAPLPATMLSKRSGFLAAANSRASVPTYLFVGIATPQLFGSTSVSQSSAEERRQEHCEPPDTAFCHDANAMRVASAT
jgi:hypothetical protein